MNRWGSGEPLLKLYICRSAEKWDDVSRFAGSVEKYTAGTIDFSSSWIPIRAAACLTMAWVFWRGALIAVWNSIRRRLPSLVRMPSGPRLHPASSRTREAFSALNSQRVFLDRRAVDQEAQRHANAVVGQKRMWRLEARPLTVHLAPRIREVAEDVLDRATPGDVDAAPAPLLHAPEQVVLDLHVPGEVVLADLDHRARGGHGVAPALHLQPIEERPVRLVVGGEDLRPNEIAGLEIHEAVG